MKMIALNEENKNNLKTFQNYVRALQVGSNMSYIVAHKTIFQQMKEYAYTHSFVDWKLVLPDDIHAEIIDGMAYHEGLLP